ncbi:hypothetical protein ACWDSJ_11940 [Nocardia sp. NPDC003482]|uniref:hypothetical protein n=1 Tax=Nocardia sp. NPDC004068 TaxID=3364303 RepID=UPI00367B7008
MTEFDMAGDGAGPENSIAASFARARLHDLRYRLVVSALSPATVVRCAGGWLFDRALAGWEVTVVVAERGDIRPLQILGADVLDLDSCLAVTLDDGWPLDEPWPQVFALDTELFHADPRVLPIILDTLDSGRSDVLLWGEVCPDELDRRMAAVQHRMSAAARAFKARACAAADLPAVPAAAVETFRTTAWPARGASLSGCDAVPCPMGECSGEDAKVLSFTARVGPR